MIIVVVVVVLLVGYVFVNKVSILKKYNIFEFVVGGLVVVVIIYILFKSLNIIVNFDINI